jgi:flagellar hook protein FlgE
VHSYYNNRSTLSVYERRDQVAASDGNTMSYNAAQNTLTIYMDADTGFVENDNGNAALVAGETIRIAGDFVSEGESGYGGYLNGREFTVLSVDAVSGLITVDTTNLALPDADFTIASTDVYLMSDMSDTVEAFYEGATDVIPGSNINYNSSKLVVREFGSDALHDYTNASFAANTALNPNGLNIFEFSNSLLNVDENGDFINSMAALGLGVNDYGTVAANRTMFVSAETTFSSEGSPATISVTGLTSAPTVGDIFTVGSDATEFTITAVTYDSSTGTADLTVTYEANSDITAATTSSLRFTTPQTISASATSGKISVSGLTSQPFVGEVFTVGADTTEFTITSVTYNSETGNADLTVSYSASSDITLSAASRLTFSGATASISTQWVDEKAPPVSIYYDEVNQRFSFEVDRSILGMGTDSGFNSFKIGGATTADGTNGLGIPSPSDASSVLIRGGEVFHGEPFVADGEEVQLNDKRYGITVTYNSDTQNFSFASGSTGEAIAANGAIGVTTAQKASNIQVGRYSISSIDGSVLSDTVSADSRYLGAGDNQLMGVGATKSDALFSDGRGLAAEPAVARGGTANEDLSEIFRLSSATGETTFNVSVNGISGLIEVPSGNYVGTTLAAALEERINQIQDPVTGDTVGGVKVRFSSADNSLTFTTGTTGSDSTIKVKGSARLGLSDVPLGVGSVPMIYNLVQATNADGVALYVDENGKTVESPPDNMVTGYYPLYIDEGELTFDKSGKLLSPKNMVSYEQQEAGFSISLQVDFAGSTQLSQPFSVSSVKQDGFTAGRLDGLEIDSSGTIRANYTNGVNTPLGKIVIANFNNQNGLKQVGNATYVETAISGPPTVGEAGAEGFGTILSGSLERSNVDITEELVNLITAQRNYQASAKAIETSTSLNQTIINIRQ